jgi:hypothetical protein
MIDLLIVTLCLPVYLWHSAGSIFYHVAERGSCHKSLLHVELPSIRNWEPAFSPAFTPLTPETDVTSCKGTLWTAWRFFEHQNTLLYLFVFQVFVFVFVEQGTCISKLFHYSVHCSFMQLCWCRTCLMNLSVTFFLWHILDISCGWSIFFNKIHLTSMLRPSEVYV